MSAFSYYYFWIMGLSSLVSIGWMVSKIDEPRKPITRLDAWLNLAAVILFIVACFKMGCP